MVNVTVFLITISKIVSNALSEEYYREAESRDTLTQFWDVHGVLQEVSCIHGSSMCQDGMTRVKLLLKGIR